MLSVSSRYRKLYSGLVALITALLVVVALPSNVEAGKKPKHDFRNSVTVNIEGGDATAVALCLNLAKQGKFSSAWQKNKCDNHAAAYGGNVTLKNVKISTIQANTKDGYLEGATNSVNLTIRGGNATAIAACLNLVKQGNFGDAYQQNKCDNYAKAVGGNVTLKNVKIVFVQDNWAAKMVKKANYSNTATLAITGGDALVVAACLNLAQQGRFGTVYQQNNCNNTAKAVGGDVTLKNTRIVLAQSNTGDGWVSDASNTVNLTIRGGDATAIATCANLVAQGNFGDAYQQNKCSNSATAVGGDVTLKNVKIYVVQTNA